MTIILCWWHRIWHCTFWNSLRYCSQRSVITIIIIPEMDVRDILAQHSWRICEDKKTKHLHAREKTRTFQINQRDLNTIWTITSVFAFYVLLAHFKEIRPARRPISGYIADDEGVITRKSFPPKCMIFRQHLMIVKNIHRGWRHDLPVPSTPRIRKNHRVIAKSWWVVWSKWTLCVKVEIFPKKKGDCILRAWARGRQAWQIMFHIDWLQIGLLTMICSNEKKIISIRSHI